MSFLNQLQSLRENIKILEKSIIESAKNMNGYKNILSIKGIGPISAATFIVHIGDIKRFANSGNLAAYFGIVPKVSQSNDHCYNGKITKRGDKLVRTALVQCALVTKKYSSYFHDFYEKIKRKKCSGVAIIATARKLLNTIFYTLKNNWEFEDFVNFTIKT